MPDPDVQLSVTGRDDIATLAREVRGRMERVLAALEAGGPESEGS